MIEREVLTRAVQYSLSSGLMVAHRRKQRNGDRAAMGHTHSNQAEYQFYIPSLPSELWTLIIDEYVSQPAERSSLALTSRLLRDIYSSARFDPREPVVAPFTR